MIDEIIYLDHNSTTDLHSIAKNAMDSLLHIPLNPSASHRIGRYAKSLLDQSRIDILNALALDNKLYNIVFTSSATEANNIAIKGTAHIYDKAITSAIEHDSVLQVIGEGVISVNQDGLVNLDHLESILLSYRGMGPILVSIMRANGVSGAIQPMKEINDICSKYDVILHSDYSQFIGKMPNDCDRYNLDMITISSHKIGGPMGVGALIYKKHLDIHPIIVGGGQEYRIRSGTHNVVPIYGFAQLMKYIEQVNKDWSSLEHMRNYMEHKMQFHSPNVIIFSSNALRLPNTSYIAIANKASDSLLINFDLQGIALSKGSACASGKISLPYVAMAMGYQESISNAALRISLGLKNSYAQIDRFIESYSKI